MWIVKKEILDKVGITDDDSNALRIKNKKLYEEKEQEKKNEFNNYVMGINSVFRFLILGKRSEKP